MSDPDRPDIPQQPGDDAPAPRPRLKKLRLLVILVPLALLALVSTVFGMMMAVASDLPALENAPQYRGDGKRNSVLVDTQGRTIGRLASDTNQLYVQDDQISPWMKVAIVAIEDERFQTNSGVDLRGIARAFTQDVVQQRSAQGGSTITQQFVKNALQAQDQRTVFQKLREAALAYHLTRKWSKQKILTEYLNSIYFGNGAYGIEAAAETYFGQDVNHQGCGTVKRPCAKELQPQEAALIAGVVASPTAYDPVAHPVAARARRDLVLRKMLDQRYISAAQYRRAVTESLPAPSRIRPPTVESKAPYFTTWVRQQLVERYGARRAFEGGLTVKTTLDLDLQKHAEQAVRTWLSNPNGPTASLVAIDNATGEVRAMVSGTKDYRDAPFNLATQGQRQPGSAFKPFILAQALREGIGPQTVFPSRKRFFCVHHAGGRCTEQFVVNNFESSYAGQRTLAAGLTVSDNSVYAAAGIRVGTAKVAALARRMGVRTPVSSNLAMTLGGLSEGVTPLDMAHAYETFADGGKRVTGTLGTADNGPVGIRKVLGSNDKPLKGGTNHTIRKEILPPAVAQTATQVMSTVVSQGTGTRAAIGSFAAGKTGTTENSGDAWFVGFTNRLTVAVWVGYPDRLKPMETEFQGGPVEGGTFPALIWHDFMLGANTVLDGYANADRKRKGLPPLTTTTTTPAPPPVPTGATTPGTATAPVTTTPATGGGGTSTTGGTAPSAKPTSPTTTPASPPPATPAPATPVTPAPTPTPTPAPSTGAGAGGATPTP
jgi:penicillin-binding protein 1A